MDSKFAFLAIQLVFYPSKKWLQENMFLTGAKMNWPKRKKYEVLILNHKDNYIKFDEFYKSITTCDILNSFSQKNICISKINRRYRNEDN